VSDLLWNPLQHAPGTTPHTSAYSSSFRGVWPIEYHPFGGWVIACRDG
jgi:hypothetical protein